ncbi:MAG: tRNA1(Val) (adenine(37)-N6)-methyltransferase [Firmicutes bacterium]|nr:tRNA1(Val) (adenine(37)-N6)-methyltransferase [Bacillota bacterium]
MERIENTGFGNIKLIQDPEQFCYGVDAVILADFANSLYPAFKKAADFGTGNGIIPLILSHKNSEAHITGVEIQPDAADMAMRSCRLNGLEEKINFVVADVFDIADGKLGESINDPALCEGAMDMVTCNPPYFVKGGAIPSSSKAKFIARHETSAGVEDFIKAAAKLLKRKGHFFMVHRPSRLADIMYYCRKYGLEPKDMRMVVPKPGEAPNIVLIHCIKGGGRELNVMKELAVYNEDGSYSDEIEYVYERK